MSLRKVILVTSLLSLLLTAAFAAPAQASGSCAAWYTVQRGDNLYRISVRYGVSMGTLAAMNGLSNWNLLYAGQTLCVSGTPQPPPPPVGIDSYIVQRGDHLSRIAQRFGVNLWTLA